MHFGSFLKYNLLNNKFQLNLLWFYLKRYIKTLRHHPCCENYCWLNCWNEEPLKCTHLTSEFQHHIWIRWLYWLKKTVIATFSSWQTCWSMDWNITYVKWKDVKGRKLEGIKLLKPIRVKGKGSFPLVWTIKPALNVPGYYRNLCDGNQNNRIYGSCKCVTKKSTYHQ